MPQNEEMVNDDALLWHGPACPQCGTELNVEPIAADHTIRIAYTCNTHGVISTADPFGAT